VVVEGPEASLGTRVQMLIRPRLATVWTCVAVAVPVAATWFGQTQAIDLAYQIRAGGLMLDTHHLLTTDLFTFTANGKYWLNQQWGAEIAFAWLWRTAGWGGVAFAWGILVGTVSLLVYLSCRRAGASPAVGAILTLAGYLVAAPILTMRPQLFGILLFAAVQWILTTRHDAPARLWVVPALVVVWANIHGSFVLVFALLAFAWLQDRASDTARARQLVIVGTLSALVTLLNPFGVHVWTYVTSIAGNPTVAGRVAEWGPPSVRTVTGALFFGSILAAFVFLAARQDRPPLSTYVALCFFAVLGMTAIRGVVWWALAFPVLLAPATRGVLDQRSPRSPVNAVFLLALALLVAIPYTTLQGVDDATGAPAPLTFAPENLLEAAEAAVPPGGRIFASEVYGSWIEFSAPDHPVFVDPRIELFPQDVWDDYFAVEDGRQGWNSTLDRWGVDVLILHPTWAAGLLAVIRDDRDWRLIAENTDGVVYARR
jgi:hypothetical protein